MTLRRRVGAAAAIAVAVAVVLVAAVSYWVVRGQLVGQVDDALNAQMTAVQREGALALRAPFPGAPANAGGPAQYVQIVLANGQRRVLAGDLALPLPGRTLAVATRGAGSYLSNVHVRGAHLRELTFGATVVLPFGQTTTAAIQLARPLSSVDNVLAHLRLILLLLCLGGIGLAVVLGRLAANRVLAPLADVAATAQHISQTEDLTSRINVHTDDEVGQLATRFNAMLERLEASRDALDQSVRAQRQLVADASHELRTPITSLRTNIELLLEHDRLDPAERRRMLADVVEQTEELSALLSDLIELARGDLPADSVEDVRLDHVVDESVHRAQRNFPQIRFERTLSPVLVEGMPDRLSRAVNNLLDNAARHSPPGDVVEVMVDRGAVRVRDRGPGVAESDLPYIFDRFYRGAGARSTHGSGLGLSIVRQVAQQHGGSVSVENAPDGGALFTLRLPAVATDRAFGDSGSGRLGDSSLARGAEPLPEQPEADHEHGNHDEQERAATQRAAE
jgi:two-component system sensor histidine kinase MprB